MRFDPQKHHRHSIRLKGYDYTQPGAYFITLVIDQRVNLFGEILNDEMQLSPIQKELNSTGIWQKNYYEHIRHYHDLI